QFANPYLALGNSPVNGIDPNGEFFEIFGLINLFTNKKAGHVDGFGSAVKAYTAGFLSAMLRPVESIVKADIATKVAHVNSLIGAIGGNWDRVGMSNRLAAGLFHYDNNLPLGEQVQSGLMREFEGFQDFLGYGYAQFNITAGTATRVDYFGGATFTTTEGDNRHYDGVTLGRYISIRTPFTINTSFNEYVRSTPLFMHEYGHVLDSRWASGPLYILQTAIPSLLTVNSDNHNFHWHERKANILASQYFRYYYGIDWDDEENPRFPRR
ncbi:hypothetical protein, partial [Parapedobacter sp. 10938]|uniref:hypothetical protein n=1 Tax=Parapedobacter flavus TaxID=3110225 RepID=UPI002DBAA9C8